MSTLHLRLEFPKLSGAYESLGELVKTQVLVSRSVVRPGIFLFPVSSPRDDDTTGPYTTL